LTQNQFWVGIILAYLVIMINFIYFGRKLTRKYRNYCLRKKTARELTTLEKEVKRAKGVAMQLYGTTSHLWQTVNKTRTKNLLSAFFKTANLISRRKYSVESLSVERSMRLIELMRMGHANDPERVRNHIFDGSNLVTNMVWFRTKLLPVIPKNPYDDGANIILPFELLQDLIISSFETTLAALSSTDLESLFVTSVLVSALPTDYLFEGGKGKRRQQMRTNIRKALKAKKKGNSLDEKRDSFSAEFEYAKDLTHAFQRGEIDLYYLNDYLDVTFGISPDEWFDQSEVLDYVLAWDSPGVSETYKFNLGETMFDNYLNTLDLMDEFDNLENFSDDDEQWERYDQGDSTRYVVLKGSDVQDYVLEGQYKVNAEVYPQLNVQIQPGKICPITLERIISRTPYKQNILRYHAPFQLPLTEVMRKLLEDAVPLTSIPTAILHKWRVHGFEKIEWVEGVADPVVCELLFAYNYKRLFEEQLYEDAYPKTKLAPLNYFIGGAKIKHDACFFATPMGKILCREPAMKLLKFGPGTSRAPPPIEPLVERPITLSTSTYKPESQIVRSTAYERQPMTTRVIVGGETLDQKVYMPFPTNSRSIEFGGRIVGDEQNKTPTSNSNQSQGREETDEEFKKVEKKKKKRKSKEVEKKLLAFEDWVNKKKKQKKWREHNVTIDMQSKAYKIYCSNFHMETEAKLSGIVTFPDTVFGVPSGIASVGERDDHISEDLAHLKRMNHDQAVCNFSIVSSGGKRYFILPKHFVTEANLNAESIVTFIGKASKVTGRMKDFKFFRFNDGDLIFSTEEKLLNLTRSVQLADLKEHSVTSQIYMKWLSPTSHTGASLSVGNIKSPLSNKTQVTYNSEAKACGALICTPDNRAIGMHIGTHSSFNVMLALHSEKFGEGKVLPLDF